MRKEDLQEKVEKTLASLEGMERAKSNPFLYTRVMAVMDQSSIGLVKPRVMWQVAASLLLILSLNVAINIYYAKSNKTQVTETSELSYFQNNIYSY